MTHLDKIMQSRRDTRHFTADPVPDDVLAKALQAGNYAPSVGLTDATRYYTIHSAEVKKAIKKLFVAYDAKAIAQTDNLEQEQSYKALKLEAIEEAPVGLVIAYDRSVLNSFTIGTVGSNESIKFSAVCAAQNIWLSLTEQGFSMGWVSILNYHQFKQLLGLPEHIEPLGYFCVGKPATDYGKQPMLQQMEWREKQSAAQVTTIDFLHPLEDIINPAVPQQQSKNLSFEAAIQFKIDQKTKPTASLGILETLAKQIALVFQTDSPKIIAPHLFVFAADHGIANHGVSAYPQDVTRQMVTNFLDGGAAINIFCKQHNIELSIVDAGVNYDFPTNTALIAAKIGKGTASFLNDPAMSSTELQLCFSKGAEIVRTIAQTNCNCIGFGEMGIGNTTTAAVLMSVLLQIPIEECIGLGTGIANEKLQFKLEIAKKALNNYTGPETLDSQLAYFGGFEIMQMAGAMLESKAQNMLILVDGFIATVAFLVAYKKDAAVLHNAIFCHLSAEQGHQKIINYLGVRPLLQLDLRLGEGTGCALAFPLLQSAVAFLNEMASFESAGVNSKEI
ncbi:nicotinate-nucleotide--dimethylbenzimidazole phosphoribosyltransferase [Flavobacterium sp. K77]|uniref:nicotinate-nucleotide--dimethylbenzimidazole phosphoribosyltransferase n=1 Tax=Flavobacterium sp. K77 TaxID=2910676 RepID=UPI001F17DA20|nr:nicotinate-nucleotide--dimethylbenzimidazole phosphoribosyltransferase [Flavobacterium sp. K77]MCF6140590.1 nicotinate-nucleotide--dimethylbenzimidazole phosphoribosyltransferase [Flavobacterium sp. K77]